MRDLQSKYRAAMAAIKQAEQPSRLRVAGRPGPFPGAAALVSRTIGLEYDTVRAWRLHQKMSEEAWIASYKLAGREDDGA